MKSPHRNHSYLFATLFAMSLTGLAAGQDTNLPSIADQALDCAWGDATFDDACAGFSAKMAAKMARYVAEHSPNKISFKPTNSGSTNGISKEVPNNEDIVRKQH